MVKNGGNRGKQASSGSKQSKRIGFIIGIIVVAIGVWLVKKPQLNSNLPQKDLVSETVTALSAAKNKFSSPTPEITTSTIRLRAVGDVMMSRSVGLSATKRNNWRWPFEGTTPYLPRVDTYIANLEFPFTDPCELKDHVMTFCAPTDAVEGLTYAGINLVSLANNHINNYGEKGVSDTKATLKKANIVGVPEYEPTTTTVQGKTRGYLSLDDVSRPIDLEKVYPILSDLATQSDAVIVLIHWGNEYQSTPSARQKIIAKALADHGVDIILGSHPHVLQPIETENNTLVVYSLGNFVFDQMWSEPTRISIILDLDLTFDKNQLTKINHESNPVTIYDFGQPRLDANK